jgi:hypothetical protein
MREVGMHQASGRRWFASKWCAERIGMRSSFLGLVAEKILTAFQYLDQADQVVVLAIVVVVTVIVRPKKY